MRQLCILALTLLLSACAASSDQRAKAFYEWYTAGLALPDRGMFFASPALAPWVSSSTLNRLQKAYNSPEINALSADYFTCSQDVSEEWQHYVRVSAPWSVPGGQAVSVVLDAPEEPAMKVSLTVYLLSEKGEWKINRVGEGSAEQWLPE